MQDQDRCLGECEGWRYDEMKGQQWLRESAWNEEVGIKVTYWSCYFFREVTEGSYTDWKGGLCYKTVIVMTFWYIDQLPISAVLGSLPISHFTYSAACFQYPQSVYYWRSTIWLSQPSSYWLFLHFPYYPLYPSALKSINYPPQLFELRPAFYRHLLPVALVLQQLWPPPIIATCDFLFQIDRFPQPPHLTTRAIRITFLFQSRSLLPISVALFSQLLHLAIVWFPCFLSSPFSVDTQCPVLSVDPLSLWLNSTPFPLYSTV